MRALKFITGHVIYNLAYTYKFQLKTTKDWANDATQSIQGCSDSYFKIDLLKNPNSEIFQILGNNRSPVL